VNHQDKLAGQTPLYYAGQLEMAQLLVEKGADVTLVDLSNKTAVEYQRKMKQLDVAEYLAN
jgi:ankyrin repeat protein